MLFHLKAVVQTKFDLVKIGLKKIQAARNARRRALRQGINERIAVVAAHTTEAPPTAEPPAPAPAPRRKRKVYREDLM